MSQLDLTAERLSLALEAARLGDFHFDLKRDKVVFSARAAEICGLPLGRALTRLDVRNLVHPDDQALSARRSTARSASTANTHSIIASWSASANAGSRPAVARWSMKTAK